MQHEMKDLHYSKEYNFFSVKDFNFFKNCNCRQFTSSFQFFILEHEENDDSFKFTKCLFNLEHLEQKQEQIYK